MTDFVEMWDEIGFPQYFLITLNGKRILYCPLPSHNRKIRDKTNGVHDVGAQKEWRVNP